MRRLLAVFALVAGFLLAPAHADAAVVDVAPSATASASYTSPWESVAAVNDGIEAGPLRRQAEPPLGHLARGR